MAFNTGAALLDALVLSIVSDESTYGYKITQDVRAVMDVSESTLYPVLRRLQKRPAWTPMTAPLPGGTGAITASQRRAAKSWRNTGISGVNTSKR